MVKMWHTKIQVIMKLYLKLNKNFYFKKTMEFPTVGSPNYGEMLSHSHISPQMPKFQINSGNVYFPTL